MESNRKGAVLTALALVLCTAGGAVGGMGIANALHNSSATPVASRPFSNSRNAWTYSTGPSGYGDTITIPGSRYRAQSSATVETTSSATASQLVGLVRIQATLGYQNGAAVGTGMILTSNGVVVTNHHVVEGSTNLVVTVMNTGAQYRATVIGSDASADVAVLQLADASGLATVRTSSTAAGVGQTVTAVGDAQGATDFTASPGRVTALDQTISPSDGNNTETLHGIIQYAADVMSGDSGGATYNASGQVVGMTTAASAGGTQTNGYAIPIATVLTVATDLANHVVNAAYTYGLPAFLGVGVDQNAMVQQVFAGTGAARSGISPGDQIVAVNGTAVTSAEQLQTATRTFKAGQTVRITWVTQSGQKQTASVRLMSGPAA